MHLHTAAAIAFHPMAGAADNQQILRIGGAITRHVHRQVFTVTALQGVCVRLNGQACLGRSVQKLDARLCVTAGTSVGNCHHLFYLQKRALAQ